MSQGDSVSLTFFFVDLFISQELLHHAKNKSKLNDHKNVNIAYPKVLALFV